MAHRSVKDRFLPGLEPGTPAADAMYVDTGRRRRRAAGPWKKPARHPCDFTAANGVRCELESRKTWEVAPVPPASAHAPGWRPFNLDSLQSRGYRYFDRCALHPLNALHPNEGGR